MITPVELFKLITDAPDSLLEMSRQHCHAAHISSVVFARGGGGGLHRVFLAWPGHQLLEGHCLNTVGIHNHRYGIGITPVTGSVVNTRWTMSQNESGLPLYHHRVPAFNSGKSPYLLPLRRKLIPVLSQSGPIAMGAAALHSIFCSDYSSWIVIEGPPTEIQETDLFSPMMAINTDNLYGTFESANAVRQHVQQFYLGAGVKGVK